MGKKKRNRKVQTIRESRKTTVLKGSLKGMSAKEYYRVQKLATVNLSSVCAKYLPDNIWKKYDRRKPVKYSQAMLIFDALNRAALDTMVDFPFETPVIGVKTKSPKLGKGNTIGRIVVLESVSICRLPKIITDEGTSYFVTKQVKVRHDNKEGLVVFSKHAIERMMERIPILSKLSKRDTLVPIRTLQHTVQQQVISRGDRGPQLQCGVDSHVFGYFPFMWKNGIWVCTTFLETEMRGTAKTEQKAIEAGLEELRKNFGEEFK